MPGDLIKFLSTALRHPGRVGSIIPSSRFLSRRMVAGIELAPGQTILELGPGTGPITFQISRIMPQGSFYVGIDREAGFVELLARRYSSMHFVHGMAQEAVQHLKEAGVGPVRAILSGLPFASLPEQVQEGVMDALDQIMTPGVIFRTFQYLHAWWLPAAVRFRRRMGERFGPIHLSSPVLLNIPPAFIMTWCR